MAKTIEQIQTLIDQQQLDPRQLINLIVDYLQANPGGGGGNFANTDLTLTANRTHNAAGHNVEIEGIRNLEFTLDDEDESYWQFAHGLCFFALYGPMGRTYQDFVTAETQSFNQLGSQLGGGIHADIFTRVSEANGAKFNVQVVNEVNSTTYELTIDKNGFSTSGLTAHNYANDAAAASAGVVVGGLYHTSGTLKVRLV